MRHAQRLVTVDKKRFSLNQNTSVCRTIKGDVPDSFNSDIGNAGCVAQVRTAGVIVVEMDRSDIEVQQFERQICHGFSKRLYVSGSVSLSHDTVECLYSVRAFFDPRFCPLSLGNIDGDTADADDSPVTPDRRAKG